MIHYISYVCIDIESKTLLDKKGNNVVFVFRELDFLQSIETIYSKGLKGL